MLASAMKDIYDRLRPHGLKRSFLQECILPDWWDDSLADTPINRAYAEDVLARQLGIDVDLLRNPDAAIELAAPAGLKLKKRQNATEEELTVGQILGSRIALLSAQCKKPTTSGLCPDPAQIRQAILDKGAPWVTLEHLVDFCWQNNLPVMHLEQIPDGKKKMDGMAVWTSDGPVIVATSRRTQASWHLFILAHELGHVFKGHLKEGELSVDQELEVAPENDAEEQEANQFAVELLTGCKQLPYSFPPVQDAKHLRNLAYNIGVERGIEPGYVALTYAFATKNNQDYKMAGYALKTLTQTLKPAEWYARWYRHLDLDDLSDDNLHVLDCLTGRN